MFLENCPPDAGPCVVTQRSGTTSSANPFGLLWVRDEPADRCYEVFLAVESDQLLAEDEVGLDRRVVVGDHQSAGGCEVEQARLDQRIPVQTAMKDQDAELRCGGGPGVLAKDLYSCAGA